MLGSLPSCPVCAHPGGLLYPEVRDYFFGVKGKWPVWRCASRKCGLLWQSPAPTLDLIASYYDGYYTHEAPTIPSADIGWRGKARKAYFRRRYGYPFHVNVWATALSYLFDFMPKRRERLAHDVAYVPFKNGGRLLDVGCGAGNTLIRMRAYGWEAVGVDFDEQALASARSNGLSVFNGSLEDQSFPDASFDVILMEHLIEHVPDVAALLGECRRLLKSDGMIVLMTPNACSLGHILFRQHWRGLEIPRHLRVYTPNALSAELEKNGFGRATISSTALSAREGLMQSSLAASAEFAGPHVAIGRKAVWLESFERIAVSFGFFAGETLVAIARPSDKVDGVDP